MRELVAVLSAGLTLAGMLTAISGVVSGEVKPVIIGFVMLAGAAVLALLRIGLRPAPFVAPGSPREHEIEAHL